jgi:hypothetical protein
LYICSQNIVKMQEKINISKMLSFSLLMTLCHDIMGGGKTSNLLLKPLISISYTFKYCLCFTTFCNLHFLSLPHAKVFFRRRPLRIYSDFLRFFLNFFSCLFMMGGYSFYFPFSRMAITDFSNKILIFIKQTH